MTNSKQELTIIFGMYRRPKFLEILLEIRREMALRADYDVELFAEIVRSGRNIDRDNLRHRLPPDGKPKPENSEPVTFGTTTEA